MRPLDPIVVCMRETRIAQGLSLRSLARRSGVTYQTIRNWENGASPRLVDLRPVAAALGVELDAWPAERSGPVIDEIAIERACHGDPVDLAATERALAVAKLHRKGLTAAQIAERLRVTPRTVQRHLATDRPKVAAA